MIGILFYSIFMKQMETRTLLLISLILELLSNFSNIGLTQQWYEALGVSPFVFICFTSTTIFPLTWALQMLAPYVLIAKISPAHIEATIFAFSASVINASTNFIPTMMSLLWNKLFFHVTNESLDDLYKLYILECVTIVICMCYLPLIPTWSEVAPVQKELERNNFEAT